MLGNKMFMLADKFFFKLLTGSSKRTKLEIFQLQVKIGKYFIWIFNLYSLVFVYICHMIGLL